MATPSLSDEALKSLVGSAKTIAVVGLSTDPHKDSHEIARLLKAQGFRVLGVNPSPKLKEVWEEAYGSLSEIPVPVDIVDLFLRPEFIPPVVEEAIKKGVKLIWMQQGITHPAARAQAEKAGIPVVEDRCLGTFVRLNRLRAASS